MTFMALKFSGLHLVEVPRLFQLELDTGPEPMSPMQASQL